MLKEGFFTNWESFSIGVMNDKSTAKRVIIKPNKCIRKLSSLLKKCYTYVILMSHKTVLRSNKTD